MAPALVPREDLAAAIGVNAGMQSTARFIGPMVGGALIAALGPASTFIHNALSFSVSLMGLLNITLPPEEQDLSEARGLLSDVVAGVRYSFSHASIGPMLILIFAISILTRPFLELFPGFNDAIFHQGPHGLGMLMSSVGLGGIMGSVFVSNVGRTKALLSWSFVLMGITSLFDLLFAATDIFWVALVSVAALGFCITCWQSTTTVLIQVSVEGRMRARVMSIYALTFRACSSLGAMIAGAFSHSFGLQKPMIGMALLSLAWLLAYLPKRRKLADAFEAALPKPMPIAEPEMERKAAE
jgi:predicted MFS family arabinose efflux permease